jgi:hypothetical protein
MCLGAPPASWGARGACCEGNAFGREESYTHLTTGDDVDSADSMQDSMQDNANNGSNEAEITDAPRANRMADDDGDNHSDHGGDHDGEHDGDHPSSQALTARPVGAAPRCQPPKHASLAVLSLVELPRAGLLKLGLSPSKEHQAPS